MVFTRIVLFVLLSSSGTFLHADLFDLLGFGTKQKTDSGVIVSSEINEKQNQLKLLQEEKADLSAKEQEFVDKFQHELDKANTKIATIESELAKFEDDREFLTTALMIAQETAQTLADILFIRKQLISFIEQRINLLENYINDPTFRTIRPELQASYAFEALQTTLASLLTHEEEFTHLQEEKTTLDTELENRKHDLALHEKELKEKEKEQRDLATPHTKKQIPSDLNARQYAELLDLRRALLQAKKGLDETKIKETMAKLGNLQTKLFITQTKVEVLKQDLRVVERKLRVYETDVTKSNKKLIALQKEITERQAELSVRIKELSREKELIDQTIKEKIKAYSISTIDAQALGKWAFKPKTPQTEQQLYEIAYLNELNKALERHIDLIEAQKEYEQAKFQAQEIMNSIITAWYKITQHKLTTAEEVSEQKKLFENTKADLTRSMLLYRDKITTTTSLINSQAQIINAINDKLDEFKKRYTRFSTSSLETAHKSALTWLKKAEEQVTNQINSGSELIKIYSTINVIMRDSIKQIDSAIATLDRIGGSILYRSEYAISIVSLKTIIPDLKAFIVDVHTIALSFIMHLHPRVMVHDIMNVFQYPFNVFIIVILFLLLLILYIFIKYALTPLANVITRTHPPSKTLFFFSRLVAVIISFVPYHRIGILSWTTIFLLIRFSFITKLEYNLFFYLGSIPYLCYLAYCFIIHLRAFNRKHQYVLLSPAYEKQFSKVFLFFSYASISIFFFREAFMLTTYGKSELPIILSAFYSIVVRACLIFLISKEWILDLLPSKNVAWQWIRAKIDRYFYGILAIILLLMIMSDPYIGGFGKLISYVLWGIVGTAILLGILSWIQLGVRRIALTFFFSTDEEIHKERFSHAKTFYGVFVIIAFIFFILLAIYFGSKIWGRPISFEAISQVLDVKIFSTLGENNQYIPITVHSILVFFGFLFGGFIFAWLFERFILQRIFHLLLVDTGVQNTISSMSNYFIILVAILLGFLRIGVSGTTLSYFIGALAVAIAFAVKGPANDFIAYFIILVERSIKIGDFVEFTMHGQEKIIGVVRKITPRTIVLRRKNSVNIVVPNSLVMASSFYNWTYTPTFLAFDDILITVPYSSDPQQVKDILVYVLTHHQDILKSPAPIVRLHDFSENGFTFLVRGFLSSVNVLRQWDIASDVRLAIVSSLRKHNIGISVPVRVIIGDSKKTMPFSAFEETSAKRD